MSLILSDFLSGQPTRDLFRNLGTTSSLHTVNLGISSSVGLFGFPGVSE